MFNGQKKGKILNDMWTMTTDDFLSCEVYRKDDC